ncbi:catio diffusion facilitator CzcD-associated flavoprotein CzcO [Jatrophihabitans sp. GAS493]|uniref:flavin-containing monooxygenase n=1 Tax=Jatrophihabitans sp. GAS493 TaxID=1907575 RepID=UPI000BB92693|nr:NAD(P)/FAD-dependent oxidoreductase [Jatrophihabitans sp. GAS493]SOD74659.1 catio diffusion facilitator CzcD-associated flavoprotein CzcO [Jatrophihabitans sp. GAS493]
MTTLEQTSLHPAEIFARWVAELGDAFERADAEAVAELVDADGFWKDILTFHWGYRTFSGRDSIVEGLVTSIPTARPRNFRVSPNRHAPRVVKRSSRPLIEAYFDFDTDLGSATGFVRLNYDADDPTPRRAWIVLTTLQSLWGFEERLGARRPTGEEYSHTFNGDNWLDIRQREQAFADRDPQVLVVGGGQAGLMIAARLRQMGADTLVVERHERVGDNWRERYHSLTLHNETWGNSLPYVPFPDTWPTFLPKDKLADWLEFYAETMELNVWAGTEFVGAERDESAGVWTATVRRGDGAERVFTVPHIVFATGGHSGVPYVPEVTGLNEFTGTVLHSSRFTDGREYAGKRAIVFGTGNSGHDIAQDLHANGATSVTLIQRSPTCVVSLKPSGTLVYAIYSEGVAAEDVDLITAAIPYDVLRDTYQWLTARTCTLDRELIDGLEAAGFRTDYEPDGTGFHMRYLRRGGGYYINVGCSDLIIDGSITVEQGSEVDRIVPGGLLRLDGRVIEADVLIFATGYANQQEGVRRLLGDEVAEKVGPIWGFDENGTMANMWQRTAQPGFWVMGGALMEARFQSRFLAVQIKAELEGLAPPRE